MPTITNDEINRLVAVKVMGLCIRTTKFVDVDVIQDPHDDDVWEFIPNYLTWKGMGEVIEKLTSDSDFDELHLRKSETEATTGWKCIYHRGEVGSWIVESEHTAPMAVALVALMAFDD